jgi:hypothetical protein
MAKTIAMISEDSVYDPDGKLSDFRFATVRSIQDVCKSYKSLTSSVDLSITINSFSWNVPGFYSLPLYRYRKIKEKMLSEVAEDK